MTQADQFLDHTFESRWRSLWSRTAPAGSRTALGWVLTGMAVATVGILTVTGLVALIWLIAVQSQPNRPMSEGTVWTQVLSEEFDGDRLDRDLWSTCYWWGHGGCTNLSNNELQWYRDGNITVADGVLTLEAREYDVDTPEGEYNYISGLINTGRYADEDQDAFNLTYGYVEVRARVPRGKGLWPAIWLLPSDHESKPEIDIMEVLGHAPDVLEMHYHHRLADQDMSFGSDRIVSDMSADWNVFGLEWTPDAIIWFFNGEEVWRFTDRRLISNEPMYLILNLAVGGDWPGDPDEDTEFPARFDIDYVRVWDWKRS